MKTQNHGFSLGPIRNCSVFSRRIPANRKRHFRRRLLAALLFAMVAATGETAVYGQVTFPQPPPGAEPITMALAVVESPGGRSPGYLGQRSPRPLDELIPVPPAVVAAGAGKEISVYQIAAMPDGSRYVVAINEDNGTRFLNRNDSGLWYARIYHLGKDDAAKPELVKEGFQNFGNDVTFPMELELPGIGSTKVKSFRTEIGYSVSGFPNGKPQVYSGRGTALQVSGSYVTAEGKLTLTVTVPEELSVTPDTQVSLRFEPLEPGLPEHAASGKVTDFLTLGSARFVVTSLTPDFASATIALVAGSLKETLKQELQLGAQMPAFSQVDLVARKTVTHKDVLERAHNSSGVIFVFGDLDSGRMGSGYGPGYRTPGSMALPLPAAEVVEQLGLQAQPKPLVVLVTRQISLDFLYAELRNKTPDYFVLADFADPLRTTFRQPQNNPGQWYGSPYPGGQEPSLRQLFNLPGNTIAIAAFDAQGKVRYVKADAGSSFLPSLAEARTALVTRK